LTAIESIDSHDLLFEELFRTHGQEILSYLCRLVGDWGRGEELAQDTFVKAYRALGALDTKANHRAWLYRIATNVGYDFLRRKKLIRWIPLLDQERMADGQPAPEQRIADRDAVQCALDQLPTSLRSPLILFSVQGYSVAEVSEMLGLSEGAVKTRLYRGREAFRKCYSGDGDHEL